MWILTVFILSECFRRVTFFHHFSFYQLRKSNVLWFEWLDSTPLRSCPLPVLQETSWFRMWFLRSLGKVPRSRSKFGWTCMVCSVWPVLPSLRLWNLPKGRSQWRQNRRPRRCVYRRVCVRSTFLLFVFLLTCPGWLAVKESRSRTLSSPFIITYCNCEMLISCWNESPATSPHSTIISSITTFLESKSALLATFVHAKQGI